ncbi:Thoeris anti-defense Tad2 family protein [Hyphomicrobium sp. DMF-1]|uniref:Thoeris anti-defense Tad2 family protein n=1 Tax=Hyphomicrobium sp. DMF-1 TaxID=3019544 RepID=UPI0022EBB100|nr:hypothetical protein [Hyphomicrobium sp. DMF-1]WBT40126.1 hypothetical protein PE058_09660 [Hyphomicrobium sp. DMF-1]
MTFGEALDQMEKGRVVSRRCWPWFSRNQGIAIAHLEHAHHKTLWKCGVEGWLPKGEWLPRAGDIFADDWENVEASRPLSPEGTADAE